jgi:hypothetical protein
MSNYAAIPKHWHPSVHQSTRRPTSSNHHRLLTTRPNSSLIQSPCSPFHPSQPQSHTSTPTRRITRTLSSQKMRETRRCFVVQLTALEPLSMRAHDSRMGFAMVLGQRLGSAREGPMRGALLDSMGWLSTSICCEVRRRRGILPASMAPERVKKDSSTKRFQPLLFPSSIHNVGPET